MTKQVAKKQESQVAVASEETMNAWGDSEFSSSDIIIAKIMLMQAASTLVQDEDQYPDIKNKSFVRSTDKSIIPQGIEFFPIYMKKVIVAKDKDGKYLSEVEWNDSNDNHEKKIGETKYQKVRRFYIILKGEAKPSILELKGVSFNTGKMLANAMYVDNKMAGLPPCAKSFTLGQEVVDYKGKKYNAFKLGSDINDNPQSEWGAALTWFNMVKKGEVREDITTDDTEVIIDAEVVSGGQY